MWHLNHLNLLLHIMSSVSNVFLLYACIKLKAFVKGCIKPSLLGYFTTINTQKNECEHVQKFDG